MVDGLQAFDEDLLGNGNIVEGYTTLFKEAVGYLLVY